MSKNYHGFLETKDNIKIAYEHFSRQAGKLVIICPGFFNSITNRGIQETKDLISSDYDVLLFDFRGHGKSTGTCTWLAREHLDLEAVLDYVKKFNYTSLGILGYSLGAATTINTISRTQEKINSLALISSPYNFWKIDYHFWEPEMFSDLKDNFDCNWRGKGARLGNIFLKKRKPITEIKNIKQIPILFIHGTKDWIVKDSHSKKLYNAAITPNKKLELIQDGLHAERLIQQYPAMMKQMISVWFKNTL